MVVTLFPGARALSRGAVLACGSTIGLAWSIDTAGAVLLPVKAAAGRRRRSDVAIDDVVELIAMGFGGSERMVRASKPYRVADLSWHVLIGRAPDSLLTRVEHALVREAQTRAIEDNAIEPPDPERCVRL